MKINSFSARIVCLFLIGICFSNSFAPLAHAEMISTETFLAQQAQENPRDRILNLLQQKEVSKKLQEYGLSQKEAQERIAALSDAEIQKLNEKIDQLPAGADAAEALIGTALFVFLVLLITDILCVTKVFKFTRCAN
jgi:uncharacterized small protein (DUF1192 family)